MSDEENERKLEAAEWKLSGQCTSCGEELSKYKVKGDRGMCYFCYEFIHLYNPKDIVPVQKGEE